MVLGQDAPCVSPDAAHHAASPFFFFCTSPVPSQFDESAVVGPSAFILLLSFF